MWSYFVLPITVRAPTTDNNKYNNNNKLDTTFEFGIKTEIKILLLSC